MIKQKTCPIKVGKKDISLLLGAHDKHLKLIEENLHVIISSRGETIMIEGQIESVAIAQQVISALQELIKRGVHISTPDVAQALKAIPSQGTNAFLALYEEEIVKDRNGKAIRVKNRGQKRYLDAVKKHDVVFGIGPAGTGKTFLAVVLAIAALKKGQVQKIILTRPAVESRFFTRGFKRKG